MRYILSIILVFILVSPTRAQDNQDEIIFKAMGDEMLRTREQLQIQGIPTPFYVSYTVGRTRQFNVIGALGSIITSVESPWMMQGAVQLFLGDYHRNTNIMEQTTPVALPAEVDYYGIRRGFWLSSDMMYKMSLQLLLKKTEYLKENPLSPEEEALDDWSQVSTVVHHAERENEFAVDLSAIENIVKEMSAIFLNYKELYNTCVFFSGSGTDVYKLTSEGVSLKFPLASTIIRVVAEVKTPEGSPISDLFTIEVENPEDLPSLEELKKQVTEFADNLMNLRDAPLVEEFYTGPVMFEDAAVAFLFVRNLLQKGALFANRTFGSKNAGGLAGRFGGQIIDKRLSVKNYTTMKTYKDQELAGYYEMDAEGISPVPELVLVDHGVFKAMLNGRTPAMNALQSTGSSRLNAMGSDFTCLTAPGTIHVQVDKGTKPEKMRSNLLKEAKAKGLKYVYIVRTMAGPASRIFRVDVKSGEETQVRAANLSFITLSKLMELKDISSTECVGNYLWNGACFSSMIYPSAVVVSNVDINKVPSKPSKEPELKYPLQR